MNWTKIHLAFGVVFVIAGLYFHSWLVGGLGVIDLGAAYAQYKGWLPQ